MPSTLIRRTVVIAPEGLITTRVDCSVLVMVSYVGFRPKFGFASDRFVFVPFNYDCCSLGLGSFLGFRPINKILDYKKKNVSNKHSCHGVLLLVALCAEICLYINFLLKTRVFARATPV